MKIHIRSIIDFFILFVSLVLFVFIYIDPESKAVWVFPFSLNLLMILKYRTEKPIVLILLFMLTYNFVPYKYIHEGFELSYWTYFSSMELLNRVIAINGLFLSSLNLGLGNITVNNRIKISSICKPNPVISWFSIFVMIYCLLFGLKGSSMLATDSYNPSTTPIFGYFIVFLLLALISSSVRQKGLIACIVILYCIKGFLYGARVEPMQAVFIFGIVCFNFFDKIGNKKIILATICAYFFLLFMERFRTYPVEFVNLVSSFDVPGLFQMLLDSKENKSYISSNQGDVYYSSLRILGAVEVFSLDIQSRIVSFMSFILNPMIMWFKPLSSLSDLASYKKDIYNSGGGGLIGVYFYTWGGVVGVIICGLFIGKAIKSLYLRTNIYMIIYALMVIVTVFKWYGYNPIQLVKICLFTPVLYYGLNLIFGNYGKGENNHV